MSEQEEEEEEALHINLCSLEQRILDTTAGKQPS
jgi:hypothetical protein